MCVLAFAWQAHPRWHLVLAGNRDELHDRPAAALARWEDQPHILAGRDLTGGGTWLGVSEQGRLAVVTNLRGYGQPDRDKASRGALVADHLSDFTPGDLSIFNPFNLIVADKSEAHFLSNQPHETRSLLAPGLYGLSNGSLDAPWPKALQIKSGLLDWIVGGAEHPEILLYLLAQDVLPEAGIAPDTPSDVPLEARQSPIFIRSPLYGTRCSTVVAVDSNGQGLIVERRFDQDGIATGETSLSFSWT